MSRKVAIYGRVSTDDQELEHQLEACHKFCDYKGFSVEGVFQDVGSGKSYRDRPQFKDLIDDLRKMRFEGVVVFRLDRLFRNVVEAVNFFQEWSNKGIEVYSISENLDTSTAIGRAMRDIILVLAQLERENISEATKARLKALKESGKKLGRPFKVSEHQIKKIRKLRKEGLSIREIARQMHVSKSTVETYMKDD